MHRVIEECLQYFVGFIVTNERVPLMLVRFGMFNELWHFVYKIKI